MTTMNDDTLLDRCVDATRSTVNDEDLAAAAERFRARLPRARTSAPRSRLRWAGATLLILGAVVMGPILVPGKGGAAFASVQEWFRSFESVRMETVMARGGEALTEIRVWSEFSGFTRIETGPVTHILDPTERTMTTLLPGDRAMRMAVPDLTGWDAIADAEADESGALEWFSEIRDFQGKAAVLPEKQTIRGLLCRGYRFEIDGLSFTLWAEAATDRPIRLEGQLSEGVTIETDYWFDEVFPAELFLVPEGTEVMFNIETMSG
ncbi:MAG: hypothetical protein AAGE01_03595 [Pseudomonadota bacterium]